MKRKHFYRWLVIALLMATAGNASLYAADQNAAAQNAKSKEVVVKVDLNKATLEELEAIKGVGPALAERIIAYRNEHGKFKTADDLMGVRGIGQSKFERIKDQIAV